MQTTTAEVPTAVLADEPITTVPTPRTAPAPLPPLAPPSTETPIDRLTRRTLGALRRQSGRVLVTGRTDVPAVVARRLAQRNPTLAARATCEDIFTLAHRVLDERQIQVCTDQTLVDAAWDSAWERVGQHTVLRSLGESARWRAEIAGAIKGRGLVRFSQYFPEPLGPRPSSLPQGLPSRGPSQELRGTEPSAPWAQPASLREASRAVDPDSASRLAATVWDLYVAYSEELAVRFVHDRTDLVAIALDELTVNPSRSRFGVVVLDPTLPLSPTMVRLLRALTITR